MLEKETFCEDPVVEPAKPRDKCPCVRLTTNRYNRMLIFLEDMLTELAQHRALLDERNSVPTAGIVSGIKETLDVALHQQRQYMEGALKVMPEVIKQETIQMMDERFKHTENGFNAAMLQMQTYLEGILTELDDLRSQQRVPVAEPPPASPVEDRNQSTGGPFANIPSATPFRRAQTAVPETSTPAGPVRAPVGLQPPPVATATVPRPQMPKLDEYPTYDGDVDSDHREWLLKIDQLIRARQLSDAEVISKLPSILKGQASTWYLLQVRKMEGATWAQWAQEIIDYAESHSWRTHMIRKRDQLVFPQSVPANEGKPGIWFIYEIYKLSSALTPTLSLGEFRSTVESKIPARLATDLSAREVLFPFKDIDDYIKVFSLLSQTYKGSGPPKGSSTRATEAAPPRPRSVPLPQKPLRFEGTFKNARAQSQASGRDEIPDSNSDKRRMGNRAPSVGSGGSNNDRVCYNCRQSGHWARECPRPPSQRSRQAIAALEHMENLQEDPKEEQEAQDESAAPQEHDEPVQSVAALAWNSVYDDEDYDTPE